MATAPKVVVPEEAVAIPAAKPVVALSAIAKPKLGQIVVYKYEDTKKADCPAVIVRVVSGTLVNLRLLEDAPGMDWKQSVPAGVGPGTWSPDGGSVVQNLDGTVEIKPVPFDAHEQIVTGPHVHDSEKGYVAVPGYERKEYPLVVDNTDPVNPVVVFSKEEHDAYRAKPATPPVPPVQAPPATTPKLTEAGSVVK
jgi:hypothetical protein